MTGLHKFSVRGLRKFQNLLFLAGFILIPVLFFADILMVKYLLALSFIGIFLGFRKAEKIIGSKQRFRQSVQNEREMDRLHQECIQFLRHMEGIFMNKGYSIKQNENEILNSLYRQLDSCSTILDYMLLKETIHRRTVFVSGIADNKQEKEQKKQYQRYEKSRKTEKPASFNTSSSQPLEVLGLPEGTKDMIVIKTAYKKLIKQYHPDINPSSEAGEKTIELNLAYEQLKKHNAS
jgi:DnaJ domain